MDWLINLLNNGGATHLWPAWREHISAAIGAGSAGAPAAAVGAAGRLHYFPAKAGTGPPLFSSKRDPVLGPSTPKGSLPSLAC
jgi:hypothetical protein